jgi:hypothetical protein
MGPRPTIASPSLRGGSRSTIRISQFILIAWGFTRKRRSTYRQNLRAKFSVPADTSTTSGPVSSKILAFRLILSRHAIRGLRLLATGMARSSMTMARPGWAWCWRSIFRIVNRATAAAHYAICETEITPVGDLNEVERRGSHDPLDFAVPAPLRGGDPYLEEMRRLRRAKLCTARHTVAKRSASGSAHMGSVPMADHTEELRAAAAECLALARSTTEPQIRAALLSMAQKLYGMSSDRTGVYEAAQREFNEQQMVDRCGPLPQTVPQGRVSVTGALDHHCWLNLPRTDGQILDQPCQLIFFCLRVSNCRHQTCQKLPGSPHAICGPALLIGDVEQHVRTRLTAMIFTQPLLLSHLGKRRENWKCQQRG